jgi:serine/threonine protein kinase
MNPSRQVLGDFELIRELGRGGMGVVYEARQVSLNRKVALKVLKAGLGLTTQAVNRFRREAAAAAKLHHTNIVPIYATGEDGEYHFYAMELIEGSSLDRIIRAARNEREGEAGKAKLPESTKCATKCSTKGDGQATTAVADHRSYPSDESHSSPKPGETTTTLSSGAGYFDQVARMFAEVADGLEHAHRQGVIHRDIKPSNLLVSPQGRLHLTDFGLARVLEEPGMTVTGEFMGSPLYMSPEQIAAGRALLDHRTDIYSLGATLYEALTLQPPFQGERRDQVISQILHKDPKPPRSLERKIPPDLETICLKALDKDPDRRYRTAGAFAEDLRRFVNRFAIEARRASLPQRAVKWARRHPAVAAAAAISILALLLVGIFARQAQIANRRFEAEQRHAAVQEAVLAARGGDLDAAEKAIERAEALHASLGEVRLLRGQLALHQTHTAEAVRNLEQAVRLLPESVAARSLLAYAYADANEWERVDATLLDMERLTPTSAEDYLFKGQAEAVYDCQRGLENINQGIQLADSTLARLIRAEVRRRYASLTGQPADVRLALEDVQTARAMKPDHPAVRTISLNTHLLAAWIDAAKGLEQERQNELHDAEQDYHALEKIHSAQAAGYRGWYWMALGDDSAALRQWERVEDVEGAGWITDLYVQALYRQGEFEKALRFLEKHFTPATRIYLLAELPNGPERAYQAWKEEMDKKVSGFSQVMQVNVLELLGHRQEAKAEYERLAKTLHYPWRNRWYEHIVEFEAGQLTQDQLLALVGNSLWNQCEAHFYVGLKHLTDGDRRGAREHFIKSAATPMIGWYEHQWSRCFLSRLDANPNWPPWIP